MIIYSLLAAPASQWPPGDAASFPATATSQPRPRIQFYHTAAVAHMRSLAVFSPLLIPISSNAIQSTFFLGAFAYRILSRYWRQCVPSSAFRPLLPSLQRVCPRPACRALFHPSIHPYTQRRSTSFQGKRELAVYCGARLGIDHADGFGLDWIVSRLVIQPLS